jgi:small-conductance mechanosensitive channel
MIAVNQPVRLGDRVVIGDAEGIVEDVGLTYTRLRTPDNRRVLIPNEELANSRVANLTVVDPVSLAQARVTVPITADGTRVREVLAELAAAAPGALADRPGPGVSVAELSGTGAVFTVGVWTADAAQAAQTGAWLRERALARLNDEGVLAALERRRSRPRRGAAAQAAVGGPPARPALGGRHGARRRRGGVSGASHVRRRGRDAVRERRPQGL